MKAIGIILDIDFEKLKTCTFSDDTFHKQREEDFSKMYEEKIFPEEMSVRYDYSDGFYKVSYNNHKHIYACRSYFQSFFDDWKKDDASGLVKITNGNLTRLEMVFEHCKAYQQPFYYMYKTSLGYYVENGRLHAFLPSDAVHAKPFHDYSTIPAHLLSSKSLSNTFLPAAGAETECSLKEKIAGKKSELESQMKEIEEKEKEQKEEIERIKKEIEEKYRSVFDLLNHKKSELEAMKSTLEDQLFMLDTQIYGIRCMNGEVVRFTKISSGKNAPLDTPAVIHQKIRFLDEELAKYVSFYDFDGADTNILESLIKSREDLRDLFFPAGKSVSIIRISNTGKTYCSQIAYNTSNDGKVTVSNILKEYEIYHGKQIAILVRDGENCYIGWTEEDRVFINGDNVFLTPEQKTESTDYVKKDYFGHVIEEKTQKEEVAARYFIFSIIQGAINSGILSLPEGTKISPACPHIIFSMADNWLSDNTYGSFDDIMIKYNAHIRKGDYILNINNLISEGCMDKWCNDRGRGIKNRVRDVSSKSNQIYQVNYIEEDKKYSSFIYESRKKDSAIWELNRWNEVDVSEDNYEASFQKCHNTDDYEFRNIQYCGPQKYIFISLVKEDWWSDSTARSNFQLYDDEYINLTFLNTIIINYIITNRKMSRYFFHNRTFSDILPFLNTVSAYLKDREQKEQALIMPYVSLKDNWQVALSEWKLSHNVHVITDYQAKRFAKWYESLENESASV